MWQMMKMEFARFGADLAITVVILGAVFLLYAWATDWGKR